MKRNPSEINYYAVINLQVVIKNSEEVSARDRMGILMDELRCDQGHIP
ncbi:MAG: hypothetical protein M3270_02740 [Thermoproteota archaeon]|nr:hypothetical protein [Thermoproteota archaeon]